MRQISSLSGNKWTLCGYAPMSWQLGLSMETGSKLLPEFDRIPVAVPGSVQKALLDAGIIKDWNYAVDGLACEWVENRDWLFETVIPEITLQEGEEAILCFDGLDGNGTVMLNAIEAGRFDNSFIPYEFNVSKLLAEGRENKLLIAFEPPPRWLGQIAETSKINVMKPRFYYTWDWIARMVQSGIWDDVRLEIRKNSYIESARCISSYSLETQEGLVELFLKLTPQTADKILIQLEKADDGIIVASKECDASSSSFSLNVLKPELWMPSGHGVQNLYRTKISLINAAGQEEDSRSFTCAFRAISWEKCANAPDNADPWICCVNGKKIFLQGFNWTPLRANFADVTR